MSTSPTIDRSYRLNGAIASHRADGTVLLCSSARGRPVGACCARNGSSGFKRAIETSRARDTIQKGCRPHDTTVGGNGALGRGGGHIGAIVSSRADRAIKLLVCTGRGPVGSWRTIVRGGSLDGAVVGNGADGAISHYGSAFRVPVRPRRTRGGGGGGHSAVLASGASDTVFHSPPTRNRSIGSRGAVDRGHTLFRAVVACRALGTGEPILSASGPTIRTDGATDGNSGGKRAVLSLWARETVCDLGGTGGGAVRSWKTAGRHNRPDRAKLPRGADVARAEMGSPRLIAEVPCRAGCREGAGDGTVGARLTRTAVGVLGSMRIVEISSSHTRGGSDRSLRAVIARGACRAIRLLDCPDGLSIGSGLTGCGDDTGNRTVGSDEARLALRKEAGPRLIAVRSSRALCRNDRLEWAIVPLWADQTVVLRDPRHATTIGPRSTRGRICRGDAAVLSHGAGKAIDQSLPPGSSTVSASGAVHRIDGTLDTIIARIAERAVRRLLGPSRTAVRARRALNGSRGRNRAVVPHWADKTISDLLRPRSVAEGPSWTRGGDGGVADTKVSCWAGLDVHHDLVVVEQILDACRKPLSEGRLIQKLISVVHSEVDLECVVNKTVGLQEAPRRGLHVIGAR